MDGRRVLGSLAVLLTIGLIFPSNAQNNSAVEAGDLYVVSENNVIPKDSLQKIAQRIQNNFSSVHILNSQAIAIESYPSLQPLDALVILLDTDPNPQDVGPNKDDCPLSGFNVGESDVLVRGSYFKMKERLGFEYDVETVRGSIAYICPGRLFLMYKILRKLEGKETVDLTEDQVSFILASAATHEVGHTLAALHVFRVGDPLFIPAQGYFMGSITSFADPSITFYEPNVARMKDFIRNAKDQDMKTLNDRKALLVGRYILLQQ